MLIVSYDFKINVKYSFVFIILMIRCDSFGYSAGKIID